MRRITILLATAAAFMLVPAAQALASGTLTVDIAGEGSGEISSVGGYAGSGLFEGSPPIACTGPPATGVCETEMVEEEPEEEGEPALHGIGLHAVAANDSELVAWEVEEGFPLFCNGSSPPFKERCLVATEGGPGENGHVVAYFECKVEKVGGGCTPFYPLTVAMEGTGSGVVASNPTGILCPGACTKEYAENTKITLTASPGLGSTFVSWKGCEKGGVNGRKCTVTMDKAKSVSAKFLTAYDVTVNREGSGLGKVSSSPGGVLCLSNCSSTTAAFKEGTSVTLTAAPSKNYVFTEWTGDCSGSSTTCSLGSLGADKTVGAKFTAVEQHNLTVTKQGGGSGTVKSNLAGINCGATCSSMAAAYYQGAVVELTATPGKGSAFGGWSGGGCSGTGTCTVTMSAAESVSAIFE